MARRRSRYTGERARSSTAARRIGTRSARFGRDVYKRQLFDMPDAAQALVQALAARRGVTLADTACDTARYKERQYDLLADTVRRALDMGYIYRILEGNG